MREDGSCNVMDTVAACAAECFKNGVYILPENYVGNGWATVLLSTQGLETEGSPLSDSFVAFASMMRKGITDYRQQPQIQAQLFLRPYYIVSTATMSSTTTSVVSYVSNVFRTP